jgi:VanZ family protein
MRALVVNAFMRSGARGFSAFTFAFVFCVFYAEIDEIHQLFVLDRSGQIKDILINSAGAVIAIGLYRMAIRIWRTFK